MAGFVNRVAIPLYNTQDTYSKFDVVYNINSSNRKIYFVALENAAANLLTGSESVGPWKKFGDTNFDISDIWLPTVQTSSNFSPRIQGSQFNEGYIERSKDGINNLSQNIEVFFENYNDKQAKGLLAFLEYVGNKLSFLITLPEPYNTTRRYTCTNFNHTYSSSNINQVVAICRESYNVLGQGAGEENF